MTRSRAATQRVGDLVLPPLLSRLPAGWLLLSLLCWSPSASAVCSDPPGTEPALVTRAGPDCPFLRQDPASRAASRQRRGRVLRSLQQNGSGITVIHSAGWRRATRWRVPWLELVATRRDASGRPEAVVEVVGDRPNCRAGRYSLRVDDTLGRQVRILGILDGLIVLERRQQLGYLLQEEQRIPRWRLVWGSPWSILRPVKVAPIRKPPGRKR